MKKRFSTLLVIAGAITTAQLGAATNCDCDCNFTGQTFFSARPQYQSAIKYAPDDWWLKIKYSCQ